MPQVMNLISSLADRFVQHRGAIAFLAAGATVIASLFLTQLQIDDNFNNLLRQSAQRGTTSQDTRSLEVESDDNACLVLVQGGHVLASSNQDALRDLVIALSEVEHVEAVHSVFDARKPIRFGRYYLPLISGSPESQEELEELEQLATSHPVIAEKMLSADGTVTLILVDLDRSLQRASEYQTVLNEVRDTAAKHLKNTELEARVTGIPALQVEMTEALKWEQIIFVVGAEVVGLLICLLVFRRLAAVVIVQAGPSAAVLWSMGGMAMVGEPLNVVNSVLAPLVLTIALTDSVHLVLRIRAARERGVDRKSAVVEALRHVGPACFLTSLTTAIAFASLATAKIEVIQRFGWSCAFAVIAAFLAVITVVPLLASTRLGDLIVRRRLPVRGAHTAGAERFIEFISRYRIGLSAISVVATLVLLSISTRLEPDIQMQQFLPSNGSALKTLKQTDEVFGGVLPIYVVVEWNESAKAADWLAAVEEVDRIIEAEPHMGAPLSVVSVLKSLSRSMDKPPRHLGNLKYLPPKKLDRLIRMADRKAIVVSRIQDVGTRHVIPMYLDIRLKLDELAQRWPDLDFRLTGWTISAGRLSESMLGDMMTSLYIAVLISFVVLVIAFRSFYLGLVSLVPNLFPLVATSATMVLLDLPLHFSSATVFSVCFGIAVDDTIHFLSSYSHEIRGGAPSLLAIRRTVYRVGEALVSSTLIMVCAFGVVLFSSVPSIHEFALVFMVVLAWALVGDLLFLPAILALGERFKRKSPQE